MSKSKDKGTRAETRVRRFLEERCSPEVKVTRRALSGSKDQGDLLIETPACNVVVEVKAGKQTTNPSRKQITEWKNQATQEAYNSMEGHWDDCWVDALVVVRYGRKLQDADVYVGCNTHMWLDDFASYVYPLPPGEDED